MGSYLSLFHSNPMEDFEVKDQESFNTCIFGLSDLEMGNFEKKPQTFSNSKTTDNSDSDSEYEDVEYEQRGTIRTSTIEIERIKIEKVKFGKFVAEEEEWEINEKETSRREEIVIETVENESEDSPPVFESLGENEIESQFKPNLSSHVEIHQFAWEENEKCYPKFEIPVTFYQKMRNKLSLEISIQEAMKNGKIESALNMTNKMIQRFGSDEQLEIRKLDFLICLRKISEAEEFFTNITMNQNNFTELNYLFCLIKYQQGDLELAHAIISQCVNDSDIGFVPEKNIFIYRTIKRRIYEIQRYEVYGREDLIRGDFCSARKNLTLAVETNRQMFPKSFVVQAELYYLLGYCSYKLKDYLEAVNISRYVVRISPNLRMGLILNVLSLMRLKLFDEALDKCNVLFKIQSDSKKYQELFEHVKELKKEEEEKEEENRKSQESLCYYSVLGVSKDATGEEIHKAFKAKMRQHHPDKHVNNESVQKQEEEIFKLVQIAFKVLGNPIKRMKYDNNEEFDNDVSDTESYMEDLEKNLWRMAFDFHI